ncbi:MAG: EVE domain-containing protein [Thermodesulfobacteriota bacterium]|nr:EVE domain-containing protein [Thermodesulfobacteriota bacterium]MEE2975468.1 EVE domain-containing protein [Thermodesulfobacteriota bacterium]|tara:strand:+ start:6301 stop:6711 length:411 start_codon:yes stop_codon:yes gene_type:complete
MKYWLTKSEPYKYSWENMLKDKVTYWDGVRNYQARNNLKSMKKGDKVFFYHSNEGKEIVGITEVIKEYYQDPTTKDERWVVVDLKVKKTLKRSISLSEIKEDPILSKMPLIKQSRLSVMEIEKKHFDRIIKKSNEK